MHLYQLILLLLSTNTFAFEDYDYYEESELEDIICSSDEECPSQQPLCKDNHCQFECDSIADCNGYPCIGGKCSRPSEFRSAVLHSSEDQFDYICWFCLGQTKSNKNNELTVKGGKF